MYKKTGKGTVIQRSSGSRRSIRLSEQQPPVQPKNTTGILGVPPADVDLTGNEMDSNAIEMYDDGDQVEVKMEGEDDIKLETDNDDSSWESGGTRRTADNLLHEIEIKEELLETNDNQEEVDDQRGLASDSGTTTLEETDCGDPQCVWRLKVSILQKELELTRAELAEVKSLLAEKNGIADKECPVRKRQRTDTMNDVASADPPLYSNQGRVNKLRSVGNIPDWLKGYHASAEFHDLLKISKVSALLPGALQVMKDHWNRHYGVNRHSSWCRYSGNGKGNVGTLPFFGMEAKDILNCRLVCKTWKNAVDAFLSHDSCFEENEWNMDNINKCRVHAPEQWRTHFRNAMAFTGNGGRPIRSTPNKEQIWSIDNYQSNPNGFLMLTNTLVPTLVEGNEDFSFWCQLLTKIGPSISHLVLHPSPSRMWKILDFDSWSDIVVKCLNLTPNLKTLALLGDVSVEDDPGDGELLTFPCLPHLKVVQCDSVAGSVIKSLLQANPQVERLSLCLRVGWDDNGWGTDTDTYHRDLNMLQTSAHPPHLKDMAVYLVDDKCLWNLQNGEDLCWMKKWPLTKLHLHCQERSNRMEDLFDWLETFSGTLTHLIVDSITISSSKDEKEECKVIRLNETLPKLEYFTFSLVVKAEADVMNNQCKCPGCSKVARKSCGGDFHLPTFGTFDEGHFKFYLPKNMEVFELNISKYIVSSFV